ncbi:MAG: FtsX-like permease family protein [Phycisphaerales bacterium]|nr:FtsX-like permease family protein [Phycisphaerales bacterium]
MSRLLRLIPVVFRTLRRSPIRSGLTIAGIAMAMYLFTGVEAMRNGVRDATEAGAGDSVLVVYRENRYCPFTSRLPQWYVDRIERLEGVKAAVPMQVLVSNCRASLDVVTFRGVPEDDLGASLSPGTEITSGSINDWTKRGDAAIVGEALAARRGVKVGDRFSAAGVTVYIAGILSSSEMQDRNSAWVHLPFLQEAMRKGGTGGFVTQFNVVVDDPTKMDEIAMSIDETFAHDERPTATRPEKAFIGRAARDIVGIADFAGILGWGALVAVFALIANAIMLAMRDRIRDHAIMQTLGWTGSLIGWMVLVEGALLGLFGGLAGAFGAWLTIQYGRFAMTMEGASIEISTSASTAIIGTGLALALGILAGVAPALRLSRRSIASSFGAV